MQAKYANKEILKILMSLGECFRRQNRRPVFKHSRKHSADLKVWSCSLGRGCMNQLLPEGLYIQDTRNPRGLKLQPGIRAGAPAALELAVPHENEGRQGDGHLGTSEVVVESPSRSLSVSQTASLRSAAHNPHSSNFSREPWP